MTEDHEPPTHLTLGVTVTLEAVKREDSYDVMATINDEGAAIRMATIDDNLTQGDLRKMGTALETAIGNLVTERVKMVSLQMTNPIMARMLNGLF